MLSINPGETVVLEGEWTTHKQYGAQFKIASYQTVYPSTVEGMRRYLGSGLIKGIGPVTAKRIVDHFGKEALDVIERDPERLVEVEGLGAKRAKWIIKALGRPARDPQCHAILAIARSRHGIRP